MLAKIPGQQNQWEEVQMPKAAMVDQMLDRLRIRKKRSLRAQQA
jgi:hypothetical protein